MEGSEGELINKNLNTTLTAWFKLNANDPQARQYLYVDIPYFYVFNEKTKKWTPRKRVWKPIISRMYFVNPKFNFIKMEPHLNIIIIEANIDDEQSNFDKKNLDEYVKFEQEYDEYLLNLHESMLQELQRKKIKQLYDVSYMNKIK
ncbi:uncharacterized protein LOC100679775 isoform X5 [Nasonia vitripennis]|uniref:Uncharacterized protein n=1 Tax=Nasonia vitripennis TaxID=7425 RepID=A0A7M7R1N4_NASVI|nr:uncharacterized protein LOC100679775 isoform X5 [Nasonia vitripennis]